MMHVFTSREMNKLVQLDDLQPIALSEDEADGAGWYYGIYEGQRAILREATEDVIGSYIVHQSIALFPDDTMSGALTLARMARAHLREGETVVCVTRRPEDTPLQWLRRALQETADDTTA